MINTKMICRIMGFLFFILAGMMLVCAGVSLFYGENDLNDFLITAGITVGVGLLLLLSGKNAEKSFNRRDGYFIVTLTWVCFTAFGMLPFITGGYVPSITNAFFETMSGFTTTGATILDDIESLPHGLLFWRSLTQWIGGLGIVFFTIAILPIFGMGNVQLASVEVTGPTHEKVHPRVGVTVKWIWTIYLILTVAETALLAFGGMSLFDSICHSFTTTATGGYSTKQDSVAYFHSPYIEYVISVFMILSGLNFTLLYFFMKRKAGKLFKNAEARWYLCSIGAFTAVIAVALAFTTPMGAEESFRKSLFQVASLHTSTGFGTADYMTWTPFIWLLLLVTMICGGCAGSTAGGMKSIRLVILSRSIKNEFKHLIHPNAVLPIKVNRQVISSSIILRVLIFVAFYLIIIAVGWIVMVALGVGYLESLGTVISSLGNVGPGLGLCGPAYSWNALPDSAKWVLSFLMLVGRLELFTVLLLFTPDFWKKR